MVWQDAVTVVALVIGLMLYLKFFLMRKPLRLLLASGLLLIVGTNLLQGYQGLFEPLVATDSYWADSLKVSNLASFLQFYETLQPTLALHSRSHPPGPIVLLYVMRLVWDQPLFVSLLLAALGVGVVFLINDFLRQKKVTPENAYFISALFLLLPAVQIYFVSSIDAIMPLLFFGVFWAWQKAENIRWWLVSLGLFLLTLSFNFASIFLIPILIVNDWARHKNVTLSFKLFIATITVGVLTSIVFHFNYWKSFLIGVQMEAQGKFFLFRDPLSYSVTRLENVLEIALFFSPWLCYLLFLSIKKFKPWKRINWRNDFSGVFAAIISLAGFFFAGGYYTGETARNANYIYPFLLVMIGLHVHKKPLEKHEQVAILTLVFGQSMLMQMFGWYGW